MPMSLPPGTRFSDAQRIFLTMQVKRLVVMGYQNYEIRRALLTKFGVEMGHGLCDYYIAKAQKEVAGQVVDYVAARNMEIEVILETRRQAYEALERSKKDFESRLRETSTKTVGDYQEERTKESIRTEQRNAEARYMQIILDTAASLRALLGLDAAQKLDVSVSKGTPEEKAQPINFDQLYEATPITDPAADRIKQLEAGPQLITSTEEAQCSSQQPS